MTNFAINSIIILELKGELMKNNIFNYATKELSQDAFLCWMINNYNEECGAVKHCAEKFIDSIFVKSNKINPNCEKLLVIKQEMNIDILIIIGKYYIIIEDKTYSNQHGSQIDKYKQKVINKYNCDESSIITVYFKPHYEFNISKNAEVVFIRDDMIDILSEFEESNYLLDSYLSFLREIDMKSDLNENIAIWDGNNYRSFFHELEGRYSNVCGWSYIDRKSGGIWGLWFNSVALTQIEGVEGNIKDMYWQTENNTLVLKVMGEIENNAKWILFEKVKLIAENNGLIFRKKRFRKGKYMTIGFVDFTRENFDMIYSKLPFVNKI